MSQTLFLTLANGLDPDGIGKGTPEQHWPYQQNKKLVAQLSHEQRLDIVRSSGLRHGRYHNFAATLAAVASKSLFVDVEATVEATQPVSGNMGVISVGGPLNVNVNWDFVKRGLSAGPRLTNPLSFPHTLVSSVPTSIAHSVKAHSFALALGHDHLAFFDVLIKASQFIRFGFAKQVLTLAVFDSGEHITEGLRLSDQDLPGADVAIAGLLQAVAPDKPHLLVLDSHRRERGLEGLLAKAGNGSPVFWLKIPVSGSRQCSFDSELLKWESITATAGILCMEAGAEMWNRGRVEGHKPFTVAVEAGRWAAGVTLRWSG